VVARMVKLPTTPVRPESVRDCNACLASAICHLVAMIALGIVMATGVPSAEPLRLTASVHAVSELDTGESLTVDAVQIDLGFEDTAAASAAGQLRLFEALTLATTDTAALPGPWEASQLESGLAGLTLGDIGQPAGHSAKGASKFFGVGGYGDSVVYVVDCSGSMSDSGKLDRAKYELLHSIEQLSDEQKYFVFFYNQNAIPMAATEPIVANETSLSRTRRWVDLVEAGGSTNPLPALLAALALKPDTIYFLSDGLFDGNTIAQVRVVNRRRHGGIPIHSIAFVSRENLALMRAISRDSGGEFRYVK